MQTDWLFPRKIHQVFCLLLFQAKGTCYLKREDMATKLSDVWKGDVFSGRLETCNPFIKWHRVCNHQGYFGCVEDIMDTFQLESSLAGSNPGRKPGAKTFMNNIRDRDRNQVWAITQFFHGFFRIIAKIANFKWNLRGSKIIRYQCNLVKPKNSTEMAHFEKRSV